MLPLSVLGIRHLISTSFALHIIINVNDFKGVISFLVNWPTKCLFMFGFKVSRNNSRDRGSWLNLELKQLCFEMVKVLLFYIRQTKSLREKAKGKQSIPLCDTQVCEM